MMRLIKMLIAVLFLAVGILIGALNPQVVMVDLGFTTVQAGLGVSVLVALLIGVVVGGMVLAASLALPSRRRMRREASRPTPPTPVVER